MEKQLYGVLEDGKEVYKATLKNGDASVSIIGFGAIITDFTVYGVNVTSGLDSLEEYVADRQNRGGAIGRVANRIEDATFTMDGAIYMVKETGGGHCLHGGICFNKRVWDITEEGENYVAFTYYSPDGENGFPGGLRTTVRYSLVGTALVIEYSAIPEAKTPIALTNHAYFNLSDFTESIDSHRLTIWAKNYTAINAQRLPTGKRPPVDGTLFDFRTERAIGPLPEDFMGYDNNFVLCPEIYKEFNEKRVGLAASVTNGKLRLNTYTDQPGMQFYVAFSKGGNAGRNSPDVKRNAYCFETQTEPNCVKHGEGFYDAGEEYVHTCVYEVVRA